MQCYTTQRDPDAFPEPETWNPDRWLGPRKDADAERAKELFMPFSKGPRACLGQNLAMMELKVTTASLLLHSRISVAPGTTDGGMEMMDHFLALPIAGRCDLQFESLST